MEIDASEQIEKFQEFIERSYQKDLHENIAKGKDFLILDFFELTKYDPKLADQLLEVPEETLKAAEIALEQFDVKKGFRVRFSNLPKSQEIYIRNLRSAHLSKFIAMEGIVRQSSEVRPQAVSAKFECPSCGNVITMPQIDQQFREPTRCTCGRKGRFRLLSKELVDVQRIVLEESPENLEGGAQPKRMQVFLREDLVEPRMEKSTTPGTRVLVNGSMYEIPIQTRTGGISTRFDLAMEANFIERVEEDYSEINISPEDEKEIRDLAKSPKVYDMLVASIAPSIYGHDKIKEAIMLQLFSGIRKIKKDGTIIRGDLHVLLIGDPGSGKSAMLTFVHKAAPKARYVAGRSASGAGLCVSPESIILTNPGGMEKIKNVVEPKINNLEEFRKGVWKSGSVKDIKIQALSKDYKIHSKNPSAVWKLEAPNKLIEIVLDSGKKVRLTANTQLFTINKGITCWKKSNKFIKGDYIATPRNLIGGEISKIYTVDLIKSNPVVHGIKPFVKDVVNKLSLKYGSIREAAKVLKIKENQFYHHWVNKKARGNIKLRDLIKICDDVNIEYRDKVKEISLYNGKKHKIPLFLDKELLYVAGLIVGDGDIVKKTSNTYSIRLSNSSDKLHKAWINVLEKKFNLSYDIQDSCKKRPKAVRTNSKILGEILLSLGVPVSPKSTKIEFNQLLLHLNNDLLSSFISGYFDADGTISLRKTKGSDSIEVTSCSEKMIRSLHLLLLRYNIHSRIRKRKPSSGRIKGKYNKWNLSITSKEDIFKFSQNIKLKHPYKISQLRKIINKKTKFDTNIDVIPGISERLKPFIQKQKLNLKKVGWHSGNLSRRRFKKIVEDVGLQQIEDFNKLAESDIFWEKVKFVKEINCPYEYVYDLTVEKSHNFVVDGILVHNTASVVKDEFLRGWALEAGAMVLADKGVLVLDEMDKISREDTSALHEAMEQQQISIAKANIQATLRTQTSILAAANPKMGRFDPFTPVPNQIDMPPALINRFDLIFVLRDLPNKELDSNIATRVLESHSYSEPAPEIDAKLLRKYLAFAKQRCFPKLTKEAIETIREFYVELRSSGSQGDSAIKPIPISARQLEAIVRLSEATARIRLKDKVEKEDALKAIGLLKGCMAEIGVDPETGKVDMDRITTGITASVRSRILEVRNVVFEMCDEKQGPISIEEDLKPKVFDKGITEQKLEEAIDKLKRSGDIFEPKKGWLQKI